MWLISQAQGVVINSTKCSGRQLTGGVPQGSIRRPILFNLFIKNRDNGAKWTLSKFRDGVKLEEVNIDTVWNWTERNKKREMQSSGNAEQEPHTLQYTLGAEFLRTSSVQKELGVLVDKLNASQQYTTVTEVTNSIRGGIRKSITSRLKGVTFSFYPILMRTCLKFWVHFWALQHWGDMNLPEQTQWRTVDMTEGLEHLIWGELRLFCLEKIHKCV